MCDDEGALLRIAMTMRWTRNRWALSTLGETNLYQWIANKKPLNWDCTYISAYGNIVDVQKTPFLGFICDTIFRTIRKQHSNFHVSANIECFNMAITIPTSLINGSEIENI